MQEWSFAHTGHSEYVCFFFFITATLHIQSRGRGWGELMRRPAAGGRLPSWPASPAVLRSCKSAAVTWHRVQAGLPCILAGSMLPDTCLGGCGFFFWGGGVPDLKVQCPSDCASKAHGSLFHPSVDCAASCCLYGRLYHRGDGTSAGPLSTLLACPPCDAEQGLCASWGSVKGAAGLEPI